MDIGGLLYPPGRPPFLAPTFPSEVSSEGLAVHWALPPLALTSLLQHELNQQLHIVPKLRKEISRCLTREDGDATARNSTHLPMLRRVLTVRFLAIALFLGGSLAFFRALMSALPPDFPQRWHNFFEEQCHNQPLGYKERKVGSVIYDMHGEVITTVGAEWKPGLSNSHGRSGEIPAFLWQAVIACEDRRFFQHRGIDPRGIARAALSLSSNGGGSTITQQLVKNVFLNNDRKWTRKLAEMFLAWILESRMSKWDILRAYLKEIYWGHGVYGIEAASDLYFGKHLSLLNVGECAMLAGIIPAPELYSPFRDPSRGRRAQARALRRMVEVGFVDSSYAEAVINEPLELRSEDQDGIKVTCKAPYFVDEVLKDLNERYGCNKVLEGGLKVYTTLDLRLQKLAEQIIEKWVVRFDSQRVKFAEIAIQQLQKKLEELEAARHIVIKKVTTKIFSKQALGQVHSLTLAEQAVSRINGTFSVRKRTLCESLGKFQQELTAAIDARLEAAITIVDPSDGAVRVLVGGRDYLESSFNRSTQAYRSPGSTFEPVVCLAALAGKLNLKKMLRDELPVPADYLTKKGVAEVSEDAPAVGLGPLNETYTKLCYQVGVDKVCRMGSLLGFKAVLHRDPMATLQNFKVTPLQLAAVYSTIASEGTYSKPFFITRVETQDGEVLEEVKISEAVEIVDERSAAELRSILQATTRQEIGQKLLIRRPYVGKVGMSEGHRDVWFAGFTPDMSCVVWLGYDDGSCVGGLHAGADVSHAVLIWNDFINAAYKDQPVKYLKNKAGKKKCRRLSRKTFKVARAKWMKFQQKMAGKQHGGPDGKQEWKDVWDWEKASCVWDERDGMTEWTEEHLKRAAKIRTLKRFWLPQEISNIEGGK